MVEHYLGVVGVVSSNLVVPTNKENPKSLRHARGLLFYIYKLFGDC